MNSSRSRRRSMGRPEDHLGYWLSLVSSRVATSLARRLQKLDVRVSEWMALRKLYDQAAPISLTALAQSMGLTKGPVSRLVDRLAKKDLIERQDSRDDARAQQIWLSYAGRKLVPKLAAIADANEEAFFGALPMNARVVLTELMRNIAQQSRPTEIPLDEHDDD